MDKVEAAVSRVEIASASLKAWIAGAVAMATAIGTVIGFIVRHGGAQ